jgi:hypothetical protein
MVYREGVEGLCALDQEHAQCILYFEKSALTHTKKLRVYEMIFIGYTCIVRVYYHLVRSSLCVRNLSDAMAQTIKCFVDDFVADEAIW